MKVTIWHYFNGLPATYLLPASYKSTYYIMRQPRYHPEWRTDVASGGRRGGGDFFVNFLTVPDYNKSLCWLPLGRGGGLGFILFLPLQAII